MVYTFLNLTNDHYAQQTGISINSIKLVLSNLRFFFKVGLYTCSLSGFTMLLQFHNTGRLKAEVTHNQQLLYSIIVGQRKRQEEYYDSEGNLIGITKFPRLSDEFKATFKSSNVEYLILNPMGDQVGKITVNQFKGSFTIDYQGKTLEDTNYRLEDSVMMIDLSYQGEPVVTIVKSEVNTRDKPLNINIHQSTYTLLALVVTSLTSSQYHLVNLWRHFKMSDFPEIDQNQYHNCSLSVPDKKTRRIFGVKGPHDTQETIAKRDYDNPLVILIRLLMIFGVPIGLAITVDFLIGFGAFSVIVIGWVILGTYFPDKMKIEHLGIEYNSYEKGKFWYIDAAPNYEIL